ncbi:hypothetical protein DWF04_015630 [Cereibacter sphaeroides f. sp. denitrificans]|nr:hypothetical protein DWF04_16285 [Cereibacter sphaeroides f. sp. denitrificans]
MADEIRFRHDVRGHEMTIELDQGVHRCIRFGRPGSSTYYFRLVTWPGYLAFSGDCGSYTFARLYDMFDFFRFAGPEYDRDDRINEGYWSEKLTAICKHGGMEELDERAYSEAIRNAISCHISGMSLSDAKLVVSGARDAELFDEPSNEQEAIQRAMSWRCPATHRYPLGDFWDYRITKASFRLVWAMRAIQWGIKQYDLVKQGRTQADHDRRVLAGER